MPLGSNDVVLITGATSGIGLSCAKTFAKDGVRLVLTGRRKEKLEALKRELSCPVHTLAFDVGQRDECEATISSLPKDFANVSVLINNAGLALGTEPAHATKLDEWERMIDTNIKGLVVMTRLLLPGMVERGRGHIVNMGSVAGTYPYPGGNVYAGCKAFVAQFGLALRSDLLGTNVRVTNIEPGMTETEFSVVRYRGNKDAADKVYAGMQPLTGEDIAECAYWAVSQPPHVNINRIEVMPTAQAFGGFGVHRAR